MQYDAQDGLFWLFFKKKRYTLLGDADVVLSCCFPFIVTCDVGTVSIFFSRKHLVYVGLIIFARVVDLSMS